MKPIDMLSLVLLGVFAAAYFTKQIMLLKRYRIRSNVLGRGEKPYQTLIVERRLQAATFIGVGVWVIDALFPVFAAKWFIEVYRNDLTGITGILLTAIGVALFISAMVAMKTSWRAGIDQTTHTVLITGGVYRFSRNPAFLGLDLMLLGASVTFGNVVTLLAALFGAVAMHLQIKQEEKNMAGCFDEKYAAYYNGTPRYLLF